MHPGFKKKNIVYINNPLVAIWMSPPTVLVFGATGYTGGSIVNGLLEYNKAVSYTAYTNISPLTEP